MVKSLGPIFRKELAYQEVLEKAVPTCSEVVHAYCCPANAALLSVSSVLMESPGGLLRVGG